MPIKATQQSVAFVDYGHGKFRNVYDLMHEINGKDVHFGQMVETNEGRTFRLNDADAAFSEYAAFEAAYYVKFPERKEEEA